MKVIHYLWGLNIIKNNMEFIKVEYNGELKLITTSDKTPLIDIHKVDFYEISRDKSITIFPMTLYSDIINNNLSNKLHNIPLISYTSKLGSNLVITFYLNIKFSNDQIIDSIYHHYSPELERIEQFLNLINTSRLRVRELNIDNILS